MNGRTVLWVFGLWLFFAGIAIAFGTAREYWLKPWVGELRAHQLGTLLVCAALFGVCCATVPYWGIHSLQHALAIGTLWLVMTIAFEFGFGHYVAGHPWSKLFADYNVLRGRVWVLVLIVTWLNPALAFRVRGL